MAENKRFNRIGLVYRDGDRQSQDTGHALVSLLKARGCSVLMAETASLLGDTAAYDLVITVGGDGTLLGCARSLARTGTPVVGVNLGRLGFLTDISPADLEQAVEQLLNGDYQEERRFLLQAEIRRGEVLVAESEALNDVVLSSGTAAQMMELELYVGADFVYRQRGDGLIISTPTGSTAYALSAGGPIMHPAMDAIVIVPMFPHTLSSRPLVVDGDSRIRIVPEFIQQLSQQVICDGQVKLALEEGCELHIYKKPETLCLLHLPGRDFFASCRNKLGWSLSLVSK